MMVGWVVTLAAINAKSELTVAHTLAAAQVFTGLCGIGAALLGLAGVARQFEQPRAALVLTVTSSGDSDKYYDITIQSEGTATARNFVLRFSPCWSGIEWADNDGRWRIIACGSEREFEEWWLEPPDLADGASVAIWTVAIPDDVIVISVSADNAREQVHNRRATDQHYDYDGTAAKPDGPTRML